MKYLKELINNQKQLYVYLQKVFQLMREELSNDLNKSDKKMEAFLFNFLSLFLSMNSTDGILSKVSEVPGEFLQQEDCYTLFLSKQLDLYNALQIFVYSNETIIKGDLFSVIVERLIPKNCGVVCSKFIRSFEKVCQHMLNFFGNIPLGLVFVLSTCSGPVYMLEETAIYLRNILNVLR